MKKILFLGLSLLAVSLPSFAEGEVSASKGGFFLEPMLTYENGSTTTNYPSPLDDSTGDVDGFGAGMRVGFHVYESLFLGADGRYSLPNFKDSALDQNIKATAYNYGPVVGLQMPTDLGIRIWGSYIIDSQLNPEKDEGVDEKFTKGSGYRLGAGVKLWLLSVNLEYQFIKYRDTEVEEAGPFNNVKFDDIEMKHRTWILSVSFPINL